MRYRVVRGRMLVVPPDDKPEVRDVVVLYDTANDSYGIQLIGQSELKGYVFEIPRTAFEAARAKGTAVNELKVM